MATEEKAKFQANSRSCPYDVSEKEAVFQGNKTVS